MKQIRTSIFAFRTILKSSGLSALITIFCYLITSALPVLTTWSIQKVISLLSTGAQGSEYVKYIFIVAFGYALSYMTQTLLAISLNAGVFEKSNAYCRFEIDEKSANLGLLQYEDPHVLNMQKRAMECVDNETFGMAFMLLTRSVCYAISVASVVVLLASYSPMAAICALITTIPYFIVKAVRGNAMYNLQLANTPKKRILSYIYGLFSEKSTAKDIRMLGAGNYLSEKWEAKQDELRDEIVKENKKELSATTICECITVLGLIIAFAFSLHDTLVGRMTVATFSACIYAFQSVQSSSLQFFSLIGSVPQNLAWIGDYREFLELSEEEYYPYRDIHLEQGIELSDVTFRYPKSENAVIEHLNLTIPAGKTTAIVGKNGSGKTTLSKLLIGAFQPDSGQVNWDGVSTEELGKENLRHFTATVSQPLNKFKLSLWESVSLSNAEKIDLPRMRKILSEVGLDFLAESDGNTALGKEFGGIELSEGQWQKLAIARCMYKDAGLVILDEPTSALDPISEQQLLMSFIDASQGKTSVIITHRLGICPSVDNIIVLDDGKIQEQGTHSDLMSNSGEYQNLFTSQREWYE
ncbi:MAG: ABC transporter ATP-binding protein/permease [Ruminococcus sp.]|nr:ABC transporter ATP-binding protein/permease [Ruminococcus sp.]